MKKIVKAIAAIMLMAAVACAAGCKKESSNGSFNGHEYVDLGLPSGTLWATCNVGADNPENYGDYFAWGETEPKTAFNYDNYKYYDGHNEITKYNSTDGLITLEPSDDAATINWGAGWKTPSLEQWQELSNNTTYKRMKQNGVWGFVFKGTNGNSIFLPGAGWYNEDDWTILNPECPDGCYMSSSRSVERYSNAWYFRFGNIIIISDYRRAETGVSVRSVCALNN